jgi:regulatory protein
LNEAADKIITRVEQQRRHKHRYNIHVNGEYAFGVHEDIVVKYRLLKDSVLTEQFINDVICEEERHGAFLVALRYIGRSMRSKKEVCTKLASKGYEEDIISSVVLKLIAEKLIDDNEYATTLTRQRMRMNKKGPLWIRRELIQKGISKVEIEFALAQFDERDEFEQALALAAKRWELRNGDEITKLRKIMNLLLRRGYTVDIARKVLSKLHNSEELTFEE